MNHFVNRLYVWRDKKEDTEKKRGPFSLKRKLVFFISVSWLVPICIFLIFTLNSYRTTYVDKTENLITSNMQYSSMLVAAKLDESIRLIQKPTYERDWEKAWEDYSNKKMTKTEFISIIRESLKTRYCLDEKFDTYAFYLNDGTSGYSKDNPDVAFLEPDGYASRAGMDYYTFLHKTQPEILDILDEDNNYVQVLVVDNTLYLIRNVYTVSNYQKYMTLVVALNTGKLFSGFAVDEIQNLALQFGAEDALLFLRQGQRDDNEYANAIYSYMMSQTNTENKERFHIVSNSHYKGYIYETKKDNYHMAILYAVNKKVIFESLIGLYKTLVVMGLLMIPLVIFTFRFLKTEIEIPVYKLVTVSKTITEGKIGTVVEGEDMPNREFDYLVTSFNHMSEKVKYLFDSVYNEKLARKDAQIAALQAQINPHFLNNTLEMMNWQARMSDDIKVCKMIEALGTVLDHSMNRDNKKEIYLSEELRCVDAYLYIMSMRFGQRLQIERDIDESLLWIHVPQLILQPIIENAIMHGIERAKSGVITLRIHHDETYAYLDVMNTGKTLTKNKLEAAQKILNGDEDCIPEGSGKHTSIGIRNVNERIKLVYGEEYGLMVDILEDGRFLSRIVLPFVEIEAIRGKEQD